MQFTIILKNKNNSKNDSKLACLLSLNKKWRPLSSIGAIWLSDIYGKNYDKFYGRFKEIGLLEVEAVFECLKEFGLDVPLGIDGGIYLFLYMILHKINFSNIR